MLVGYMRGSSDPDRQAINLQRNVLMAVGFVINFHMSSGELIFLNACG